MTSGRFDFSPVQPLEIATESGFLSALLHLPENMPAPVVVCCHGMLSSKASSKFALIAEELARAGAVALRFDFSGCGESTAILADTLIGSRLRDLDAVLDFVRDQSWCNGKIGLVGSSLGGYLSLLVCSGGRHSIGGMACWATPFDLGRIAAALEGSLAPGKFFPPGFRLGSPVNLGEIAPVGGVLLVHGQLDETVPWLDAVVTYQQLVEPKGLLLVRSAEHRFVEPACRALALRATLQWLRGLDLVGGEYYQFSPARARI
jgi:uncharacterized protein